MFEATCAAMRESIYGVLATSAIKPQGTMATNGTGFMVSPGYLVTAAHCLHQNGEHSQPPHSKVAVIRAPDVGQAMEAATIHAVDDVQDIGILKIDKPRSTSSLTLIDGRIQPGAVVGSLGFPLAGVVFQPQGVNFNLVERFQGSNVSTFVVQMRPDRSKDEHYETDSLMYGGSSGCPGFTVKGEVWGMHNRSAIETPKAGASGGITTRLAISLWVPSTAILTFCRTNGLPV